MWLVGMVEAVPMFDAEFCPDPAPDGYPAALVYAGGSSAAHPWEPAELARVAHLHNLPAWVPTPGRDDPYAVADEFITWLAAHDFPPIVRHSGQHQAVMWDMETAGSADAAWLDHACTRMAEHGYWNLPYGSAGTLFGLPARDGYMVADWTRQPHMFLHPQARITQWIAGVTVAGGQIDISAANIDVLPQLAVRAA